MTKPKTVKQIMDHAESLLVMPRAEAADLLRRLAEEGQYGHYPHEVPCERLGTAIVRLILNSREDDPLGGFLKGFDEARKRYGK